MYKRGLVGEDGEVAPRIMGDYICISRESVVWLPVAVVIDSGTIIRRMRNSERTQQCSRNDVGLWP